ncbi:hypothetical protein Tco_0568578 [Tanacetum coccineum]
MAGKGCALHHWVHDVVFNLSCLLKEQLLEPALNLTVHCCGLEFRVLNGYDQKSFDEERGLNCVVQTFNTIDGNSVKKILLKLNLFDHKSILTDSKMVMERQSVKAKEIQERCIIKAFQDYEIKKEFNISRTNAQAEIVSEEQLVPCANRLVIKKNNQRIPPPDPNNTYIKSPIEIQILEFIKTLGYDEDPKIKMIVISKMVATRLHQPWRAILSVLNKSLMGKDSSWDTVRLPIL